MQVFCRNSCRWWSSPAVATPGEPIKKSPFHAAQPGTQELILIFHTMQNHQVDGDTDEQLVRKCEKQWFYAGHNERTIQSRLTFLAGYMEEFRNQIQQHRYEERNKQPVYRSPAEAEMEIITQSILKHREKGIVITRLSVSAWRSGKQDSNRILLTRVLRIRKN